jgi:hypothetical protein
LVRVPIVLSQKSSGGKKGKQYLQGKGNFMGQKNISYIVAWTGPLWENRDRKENE